MGGLVSPEVTPKCGGHRLPNLRPLVAEVVGPAGAGKTTLADELGRRDGSIQVGIPLGRLEMVVSYAATGARFLPTYVRHCRRTRWFTTGEARAIAYLHAWEAWLERGAIHRATTIVLDHGPIFRLCLLTEFGPPITSSRSFERWWYGALTRWGASLHTIVWLDAPNDVLVARLRSRARGHHTVNGWPDAEAVRFLDRYRASYDRVVGRLLKTSDCALLRFDTQQRPMSEITDDTLTALREGHRMRCG